jgi:inner membrane protein
MLLPTHASFAAALAYLTGFPMAPFILGSVLPDLDTILDFGFPLVHRGVVHTLLFIAITVPAVWLYTKKKDVTMSYALGFMSHIFIDTLTPMGIMWLYPLPSYISLNLAGYDNIIANTGIILASLFIASAHKYKLVDFTEKELHRFAWVALLMVGVLAVSAIGGNMTGYSTGNSENSEFMADAPGYGEFTVSDLLEQAPVDQYVSVTGNVSEILEDYVSKKGYSYQQFYISDGSEEILVFCSTYKGSADVSKGDTVSVSGKFQKYYNKYEIYLYCSDVQKQ